MALQVADLAQAVLGKDILLGPYEPIEGVHVAIINDNGVPIALIQTCMTPDAVGATGQTQPDLIRGGLGPPIQPLISEQERNLLAAMRNNDVAGLDALLHDDLLFTLPDGRTITKAMDLEVYRSGLITIHELVASDQIIRVMGSTAVVTVSIRLSGIYQHQPVAGTFRYLRVWKLVNDQWKVIAGTATRLD